MRQERIKDRVLKRAARAWGFSDIEMETTFDPAVSLLLNALSDVCVVKPTFLAEREKRAAEVMV